MIVAAPVVRIWLSLGRGEREVMRSAWREGKVWVGRGVAVGVEGFVGRGNEDVVVVLGEEARRKS